MSETDELANKLARRQALNEDEEMPRRQLQVFNPFTEFKEFTRKQIKDFEKMFKTYDVKNDHYLDLMEMKMMMEKLGAPQTHVGLKNMIAEIDEDNDGKVSFREFLLIFRKAAAGELLEDSGLSALARLAEVDVDEVGVGGAAKFFEAKVKEQASSNKFEAEIRQEQEERKKAADEAKARKQAFKAKQAAFGAH
ncbi:EF-hand domain-containing protein D2-like [Stylophora pistillata]|uniref:EF-hand domain-containing protein D2 n=1 Tax=Stylophora pistillata TaxID=50429 RepID=A0A2B4S5K1_STYPI|nr:EF-hand domain-containing protein D2-like [Stylophora pistillata]PFX23838.1 EF-hand domain-containing protein D2 [Stylophora pistillata]